MIDDTPDLFKNLSEEEMQSLMGIFNKVMNTPVNMEELESQAWEKSAKQYEGLFNNSQSILDSPVELVFTVACNVLNKNQKGEIVSTDKVILKYYHVPLDNKQDVERYVEGFFNKFHDKMDKAAAELFTEKENAKNTEKKENKEINDE